LRIALVSETFPPEINGVAMTLGRLVEGLTGLGHQLQVVRPRQTRLPDPATPYHDVPVPGLPLPRYQGLRFGLPAPLRLIRLWRQQRPDLVHVATEGPLGWSAIAAARYLGVPVTSAFHTHFDHYSRHYGLGWLTGWLSRYLRHVHNLTAATFVPTRALAQQLASAGYTDLHVLARGVDARLFHPAKRCAALRQSWGLGEQDVAVLHVGRIAVEKNLGHLQAAFAAIQARHPGARLILVGDGPERAALQALSQPNWHFAGARSGEDLARHYASGDLFLFPSLSETYGNVTLEAMASGLPVVAYACAGAAEVIHHGEDGLLAAPGAAEAFCYLGLKLAGNAELRQRLGQAARKRVEHQDWDSIYRRFAASLLEIVQRHERRRAARDTFLQFVPD
jgi:glycosyltransferase involved in cell wall biosynthesis